jgi:hypothetical protein
MYQRYTAGDVLVQCGGEPWPTLAWLFTGAAFPHAMMVSRVDLSPVFKEPTVFVLENSYNGVHEKIFDEFDHFEVWRPYCDAATKLAAVDWMRAHVGEGYGYGHLAQIVIGYRLGLRHRPGMDDDVSQDGRRKVCSETIAMAYYRSGYDLVPAVQDVDTLPKDLRNADTLRTVWVPRSSPLYNHTFPGQGW